MLPPPISCPFSLPCFWYIHKRVCYTQKDFRCLLFAMGLISAFPNFLLPGSLFVVPRADADRFPLLALVGSVVPQAVLHSCAPLPRQGQQRQGGYPNHCTFGGASIFSAVLKLEGTIPSPQPASSFFQPVNAPPPGSLKNPSHKPFEEVNKLHTLHFFF